MRDKCPPSTPEHIRKLGETVEAHNGNKAEAARILGMNRRTVSDRYQTYLHQSKDNAYTEKPFSVPPIPKENLSTEELLAWRKKQFEQKRKYKEASRLRDVLVNIKGPIGIVHFGDPHVDDDGTDLGLIEQHINTIKKTEGLFGANLGDAQNAWVGRLTRLWAEQGTSASQAWQLVEWFITSVHWLYLVQGNHDLFCGNNDPLKWIMANTNTAWDANGVRINLKFPNRKEVRVNARHDFAGHSMWNPSHGPMKAIQGGWRDHILTCGHKHVSFIGGPLKDPSSGLLSWAIRCAGYKTYDRYAEELGLPDQNAFAACVTIINPIYEDNDPRLITVIPDVEQGADFLTFLRRKFA